MLHDRYGHAWMINVSKPVEHASVNDRETAARH
jgi:hypothetical protein